MKVRIEAGPEYTGTREFEVGKTITEVIIEVGSLPPIIDTQRYKPRQLGNNRSPWVVDVDIDVKELGFELKGLTWRATQGVVPQRLIYEDIPEGRLRAFLLREKRMIPVSLSWDQTRSYAGYGKSEAVKFVEEHWQKI